MAVTSQPSREAMQAELLALRQELLDLQQERDDLEMLLEMTTEHSDTVEEELHDKAEAALRESERRLRLIVEATPAPVLIYRLADGEIVYANVMSGPSIGWETEALVGQNVFDFFLDEAGEQQVPEILSCQEEVNNYELQVKKKDGTILWVEASVRLLQFNEEASRLVAFHDITRRKEAFENLQQIDKLKDEFLANTSHELRTPLNGIIGIAESMVQGATGKLTTPQKQNLSMIVASGSRLTNLVNDLLDFSKLRHKEITLQTKPLDIRQIAEIVLTLSRPLIKNKPISLENHIPFDPPSVIGDENRLQQILLNLVGNAIKFTSAGVVALTAVMQDEHLAISVSDTGIGIPADKIDAVFRSFEQVDASTERTYGGTGLGLPITKQLVELHGGTITVDSTLDEGSTFTFTLPITNEKPLNEPGAHTEIAAARDYSEPSETLPITTSYQAGKYSILVVDDEPVNRQVLLNHLSLQNYSVIQAEDGLAALDAVANHRPDLILLDVMMPRMSGYKACQQLRKQYSQTELPIVMLTAKNQVANLVEGFKAGANDYLTKPFSRDELISRIQTHLRLATINRASSRFVPREFLSFLGKDSIVDISLGDHISKQMAVMFSDVRSFTAMSEDMTPQENFDFVNAYLQRVSPIIREYDGFIVKYLGDGMMAVFPETADDAVHAGIEKLNQVHQYNERRTKKGYQPIQVGIGVHYGHMMVGMVGENSRIQGDAFSNQVNVTARLESLTKYYRVSFILSADTYQHLADPKQYNIRFLDIVQVKGQQSPIHLYEVFDADPPAQRNLKLETCEEFEAAQSLYFAGQFAEAQTKLFGILQRNPSDRVAWHFLVKATQLLEEGVSDDWTGITIMTSK
jgi:two-component system sensor histidine kinase ChiS